MRAFSTIFDDILNFLYFLKFEVLVRIEHSNLKREICIKQKKRDFSDINIGESHTFSPIPI